MVTGTSLRFIFEVTGSFYTLKFVNYLIVLPALMQVTAAVIYVYVMRGRIRPVGSQIREAKGERF